MGEAAQRRRVLVADDHPAVAERVCALLREAGMEVLGPARDGADAIRWIETVRPDGAVIDVMMPVETGIGVVRKIRELGFPCVVVMLTLIPERSIAEACIAEGADYVLQKGDVTDELAALFLRRFGIAEE